MSNAFDLKKWRNLIRGESGIVVMELVKCILFALVLARLGFPG